MTLSPHVVQIFRQTCGRWSYKKDKYLSVDFKSGDFLEARRYCIKMCQNFRPRLFELWQSILFIYIFKGDVEFDVKN